MKIQKYSVIKSQLIRDSCNIPNVFFSQLIYEGIEIKVFW